jgi:hypothetical protein
MTNYDVVDAADAPGEERVILAGEGAPGADGLFDVALISAGESIDGRFSFDRAVLSDSLPLWDRVECFVDHDRGNHRSVRDLGGVFHSPRFDEVTGAVMATLKVGGPAGPLVAALGREMLADGDVKPRVGFSADVGITTDGKRVRRITKVFSVDLVFNPARGWRSCVLCFLLRRRKAARRFLWMW